jgi:hypothetical protein
MIFIDSFMDDDTYVKDVEVCMYSMIFVTYQGTFAMAMRILDWDLCMMTVGLAGASSQFYPVAPYRFDYRFVVE